MKRILFFLILSVSLLWSCGGSDDNNPQPSDNFDRKAMLTHWADNIIIPGLEANEDFLRTLETAALDFREDPTAVKFVTVQDAWLAAYREWQRIAMFEIGKAEEVQLINKFNLYPTDTAGIEENIANGSYNLALPSENTRQGFPALDYLLYGLGADNAETLAVFQDTENGEAYREYILAVSEYMHQTLETVLADWRSGYRETFINNDGNSATAATDRLVNDYIFYYEKHLRAGKIGIPAGVFSGEVLPGNVEGLYREDISRELALLSLNAVQDFFMGQPYVVGEASGPSLNAYLSELSVMKGGVALEAVIDEQFEVARTKIEALNANFAEQVDTDNMAMLEAYDAMQVNVVNLKVDMLQALNINVDYVDADGD